MKISIVMGFSSSMDEIIKSGGVGLPIFVDVSMAVLKEHESGGLGGFVLAGGVRITTRESCPHRHNRGFHSSPKVARRNKRAKLVKGYESCVILFNFSEAVSVLHRPIKKLKFFGTILA